MFIQCIADKVFQKHYYANTPSVLIGSVIMIFCIQELFWFQTCWFLFILGWTFEIDSWYGQQVGILKYKYGDGQVRCLQQVTNVIEAHKGEQMPQLMPCSDESGVWQRWYITYNLGYHLVPPKPVWSDRLSSEHLTKWFTILIRVLIWNRSLELSYLITKKG